VVLERLKRQKCEKRDSLYLLKNLFWDQQLLQMHVLLELVQVVHVAHFPAKFDAVDWKLTDNCWREKIVRKLLSTRNYQEQIRRGVARFVSRFPVISTAKLVPISVDNEFCHFFLLEKIQF